MPRLTDADFIQINLTHAVAGSVEELKRVASLLQDYSQKMLRYAAQVQAQPDMTLPVSRADRMTWAINDVENCMRNFNLSNLARRVADLTVAEQAYNDLAAESTANH